MTTNFLRSSPNSQEDLEELKMMLLGWDKDSIEFRQLLKLVRDHGGIMELLVSNISTKLDIDKNTCRLICHVLIDSYFDIQKRLIEEK